MTDTELLDTRALDQAIAEGQAPMTVFRQALKTAQQILIERYEAGRVATELVPARAAVVDIILRRAWQLYLPADSEDIALLAVGGYGRGELHPASDIDLLILLQGDDAPFREGITDFLTFLWDIGLEVGQSVRNVEECVSEATGDITIATNIQESRLLIGAESLYQRQQALCSADRIWPGPAYFKAKLAEQVKRHLKYHETAYNLEPNVKESPGGLRDIQMIGWVAKRHYGVDTLSELVDHGFLTAEEYRTLHEGQAFLWQVRFGLHVLAKRREDRLLFDHQRSLAQHFGYRDKPGKLAVEQFMKHYYRIVMELNRLNEMLLQLFQEEILYADDPSEPVIINRRFQSRKGFLEVSHDNVFSRYPFALLEIFLILEQHPELKGVRANTIRLIRQSRELIDADFRADLRCRSLFMEIMRQTAGITHELRRMNRYGILAAYLPLFGKIVGQMQHDLFHVYTVDEHTLMVVRNLRRFTVPEFAHEFPLASEIIQTIPKQELLLIAGLFHDIAKGRGGDHATLGAVDAAEFCRTHGLSDYDTRIVSWLVEQHLLMSTTAQRKDISDPEVVQEFAEIVGDETRLKYLYLLTVADIRATSDKIWNSWKDALLKGLYKSARAVFRRGLQNPLLISEKIADTRNKALVILNSRGFDKPTVHQLWDTLGEEYFIRYLPEEICWHSGAILTHHSDSPLVLIKDIPARGGSEVFIYARSFDSLFLNATTVLERNGVSILEARIFDSSDGYTLDSFLVMDANGKMLGEGDKAEQLSKQLKTQLQEPQTEFQAQPRQLPRQAKHFTFPTQVGFESHIQQHRTIMHVTAFDRPGLLSRIALVLHNHRLRLTNARIATFGERAEDIFYITDQNDKPITDPELLKALADDVKAALEVPLEN